MNIRLPLTLSALLLVGLSACDRSQPEPQPEPQNEPLTEDVTPTPEPEPAPLPEPAPVEPANVPVVVAETPPPPEPTPPDEQMLEDAEATGMTARVTRGDGGSDSAPAETNRAAAEQN